MNIQELIEALERAKEIFGPTAKIVIDTLGCGEGFFNVSHTYVFDEGEIGLSVD